MLTLTVTTVVVHGVSFIAGMIIDRVVASYVTRIHTGHNLCHVDFNLANNKHDEFPKLMTHNKLMTDFNTLQI